MHKPVRIKVGIKRESSLKLCYRGPLKLTQQLYLHWKYGGDN